jgi:hypothetical protein
MMARSLTAVAALLTVLGGSAVVAQTQTRTVPKEFAHVRMSGRALAEYHDEKIQVAAAYYYSQRNHDSPWLLIELGAMTPKPATIQRNQIELVTPAGRVVPLATQERWGSQTERNVLFMQQVNPTRHQVASYFKSNNGTSGLQFFVAPAGTGTVLEFAQLRPEALVLGDLLFEAPTRLWEKGTYALIVRYSGGEAVLPIELQ